MAKRRRVYVAGKYSANNVLDVLKNIGRGEKECAKLFAMGYAPFCPWHDKSYVTDNPNGYFTVEQFYEHGLAWLEVSDAVLVLSGWQTSQGTIAEIEQAKKFGVPVFYSIDDLNNCREG
jgi:hypothetical protein